MAKEQVMKTKKKKKIGIRDIGRNRGEQLAHINTEDLMPLPFGVGIDDQIESMTEQQKADIECSLDGTSALNIPKPKNKAEEEELVKKFLNGLEKLLTKENNWTFLLPLTLSLNYCGKCLACSEECPIYLSSGRQDIYRPNYRAEVLRRIIKKYSHHGGARFPRLSEGDIDLNWETIARLAELSFRCTICRRCTQSCTRGVDNGLITHELRKVFSQEMGITAKELHQVGTVQQLKVGSSTGISPKAFKGIVAFMEDEIEDKLGRRIEIPVDKEGADILLIHNSGEYMSWLENPEAFAIIFEAAGLNYTLSSELAGYEATNYGLWYDDAQFARIVLQQTELARKLKVKKIVIGECGHAHKAMMVIADRLFTKESYIPRESFLPVLEQIVFSRKIELDPQRNNFPVTLHDPCNVTRLMGIVEPQRRILRHITPQFREMTPHGVNNYCCGGGSGFAIMSPTNFADWRDIISGRMKVKQVLEAFEDVIGPETNKYVCLPCSNCKGQFRENINRYNLTERYSIIYGGLVELVVNAMTDMQEPFIQWEESATVEEGVMAGETQT
ncbi:(Fe-S)-binding protein [Chloroflexota bacterium]